MYPALKGIEERFGPTQVHLQVYDGELLYRLALTRQLNIPHTSDAAHVLPILFSFTTPSKYCFRAIANFIRHVTDLPPVVPSDSVGTIPMTLSPPMTPGARAYSDDRLLSVTDIRLSRASSELRTRSSPASRAASPPRRGGSLFNRKAADDGSATPPRSSLRRALSTRVSRAGILFKGIASSPTQSASPSPPPSTTQLPEPADNETPERGDSGDIAGPRFYGSGMQQEEDNLRRAGEPAVYQNGLVSFSKN